LTNERALKTLAIKNFSDRIVGILNVSGVINRTAWREPPVQEANKKGTEIMANIKSAKKRILTAEKSRVRNVAWKSSIKTAVKKVLEFAVSGDKEALDTAVSKVYRLCDKAVGKGILHKNTAARKKSRLTIAVNKLVSK
jgi:small subunit ribosomal protein S20